jgi:hypothetical protein
MDKSKLAVANIYNTLGSKIELYDSYEDLKENNGNLQSIIGPIFGLTDDTETIEREKQQIVATINTFITGKYHKYFHRGHTQEEALHPKGFDDIFEIVKKEMLEKYTMQEIIDFEPFCNVDVDISDDGRSMVQTGGVDPELTEQYALEVEDILRYYGYNFEIDELLNSDVVRMNLIVKLDKWVDEHRKKEDRKKEDYVCPW